MLTAATLKVSVCAACSGAVISASATKLPGVPATAFTLRGRTATEGPEVCVQKNSTAAPAGTPLAVARSRTSRPAATVTSSPAATVGRVPVVSRVMATDRVAVLVVRKSRRPSASASAARSSAAVTERRKVAVASASSGVGARNRKVRAFAPVGSSTSGPEVCSQAYV